MWRWTSDGCTQRTLESTSAEQPISMGQTRPGRSSNAPARQESCTSHSFRRAWCPSTGSGRWNLAGSVPLNSWRPKRKSSSLALWQNQKQWALRKVAVRDSAAESLDIQSQGWCGWSTGTLWSMWVYIPDMGMHDWDDYTYQCLINHDCLYLDNDLIHGQMLRRTLSLPVLACVFQGSRHKLIYDGMWHLDIPKCQDRDGGKIEVIARNQCGEAYATTTLTVKRRKDDYRSVLRHNVKRKYKPSSILTILSAMVLT